MLYEPDFENEYPELSNFLGSVVYDRNWNPFTDLEREITCLFKGQRTAFLVDELAKLQQDSSFDWGCIGKTSNISFESDEEARGFLADLHSILERLDAPVRAREQEIQLMEAKYPVYTLTGDVKEHNRTLTIDGRPIDLPGDMRHFFQFEYIVVVRLDIHDVGERNVLALNHDGEILWQIQACPWRSTETGLRGYQTASSIWHRIWASSWTGHHVEVDPFTGDVRPWVEEQFDYGLDEI